MFAKQAIKHLWLVAGDAQIALYVKLYGSDGQMLTAK